jgi:hypothetical protein
MHRAYASRKDGVQKGLQPTAVEVNATADVAVDGGLWVGGLQLCDLAFEVARLLARGYAGVDGDRGLRWFWFVLRDPRTGARSGPERRHVVESVLAVGTAGQQHGGDLSLPGPEGEGAGGDV